MKKPPLSSLVREGNCPHPAVCPLSRVRAGTIARIKELSAAAHVQDRLREMGFCEEQTVKLLSREGGVICQVCNARLGLSAELADSILVEPLPRRHKTA